jgi:hypothetical protein
MKTRHQRHARATEGEMCADARHEEMVSTVDLVLLCCFSQDLVGERTRADLRQALLAAGFPGPAIGHLIGASPLLRRSASGKFRLREFRPKG